MPEQGNAFGLDCSSGNLLTNLPWPAIKAWRAAIPPNPTNPNGLPATPCVFAGRYFNPWNSANNWAVGENAGVRTAIPPNQPLNADLEYVVPIQGFKDSTQNRRVSGRKPDGSVENNAETVQGWGAADAKGFCDRIVKAVQRNELKYPFFNTVIVYLDIEPNVTLSADYWYGWASAVYWYCTGFHHPFYPGLYCTTKQNPDDHGGNVYLHRIPSDDVQGALTGGPNTLESICWGIWAANPQTDTTGFDDPAFQMKTRYDSNFRPDWENRFDEWKQMVRMVWKLIPWNSTVRVRLWQYGSAPVPANPAKAGFNALRVDLNEKSPDWEAIAWMLKVV